MTIMYHKKQQHNKSKCVLKTIQMNNLITLQKTTKKKHSIRKQKKVHISILTLIVSHWNHYLFVSFIKKS